MIFEFTDQLLTALSAGGTIKLKSNNPFDKPLIDPQYLTTQFDVVAIREGVKAVKNILAAPAFADYVEGPFGSAFASAKTDAQIESYVRGLTSTIFHPVSTASMSSQFSKSGVVNPDLTVKGTEGLRVVDASVFVSDPMAIGYVKQLIVPLIALHPEHSHSGPCVPPGRKSFRYHKASRPYLTVHNLRAILY